METDFSFPAHCFPGVFRLFRFLIVLGGIPNFQLQVLNVPVINVARALDTQLLSIYAAKLKTPLLKTRALRAANDSKRAVNALTALQLIGSRFIIR